MQKIPCLCFQEETSYMYAKIMNRRIQKMIDGKRRETHSCWNRSTGKKRKRRMKEQQKLEKWILELDVTM